MIVDQNSHSRFPVNHRTRFSTHSCQSVGAKRLFTTRPRRSSTIPVIEDNTAKSTHCVSGSCTLSKLNAFKIVRSEIQGSAVHVTEMNGRTRVTLRMTVCCDFFRLGDSDQC
ncbi:MAG: hypothetical protein DWI00_05565 [Planctomycetota bacterium]|nr:MAG: hypothetical protein DWI00_05565 [Planctomycetota bacterium]